MTICVYCGVDCHRPPSLRQHLKGAKHPGTTSASSKKHGGDGVLPLLDGPSSPKQPSSQMFETPGVNHPQTVPILDLLLVAHQELRILQYNVQKSRDVVLASLFQDRWITEYDIVAIQEPWRNPFIATTYHPLKTHFQPAYLEHHETRVCFYINKRIDPSTWTISFITKDIIALEITHPILHHPLSIVNVYHGVGSDTLHELRQTLAAFHAGQEIIVLGDFNLHHPLWSTTLRHASHGRAACQPLLSILEDFQLRLLTVPGTTTHRWKDGESTIDLTFATEEVTACMIYCQEDTSRDCDSDHLPIATAIAWDWEPAIQVRKRLWTKTNPAVLWQVVKERLCLEPERTDLSDRHGIDKYVGSLVTALQTGIDASTPWSRPSQRSVSGFTQECKDLCREVQQLRRKWQQTRLENDYEVSVATKIESVPF